MNVFENSKVNESALKEESKIKRKKPRNDW